MSQSNASSKVRCPFYFFHRLREREIHCMVMAEKYGGDEACRA